MKDIMIEKSVIVFNTEKLKIGQLISIRNKHMITNGVIYNVSENHIDIAFSNTTGCSLEIDGIINGEIEIAIKESCFH